MKKLSVFWLLFAQALSAHAEELDLRSALKLAETQSLELKTAETEVQSARLAAEVSLSKLLPSLDFTSTHGRQGELPKQKLLPKHVSQFEFSLSETLFDNGVSWTHRKIALLSEKRALIHFEIQKNKLALDLATGLFRLSLAKKTYENQLAQSEIILKQFKLIERDYYQGIKSRRDYLRLRTQRSRSALELEDAKTQVKKAHVDLNRILGSSENDLPNYSFRHEDLENAEMNVELKDLSSGDFLLSQRAELDCEIHNLNKSLVSRNRWPEVNAELNAKYGSGGYWKTPATIESNDGASWSALLSLNYNIFDWGQRSKERQIAALEERKLNSKVKLEVLQMKSEVSKNLEELSSIQNNLKLSKELRDLEKINLADLEKEYRNGKVLYLDLMNGLKDYSEAQIRYQKALADFRIKTFSLLAQKGKLYEFLLQ